MAYAEKMYQLYMHTKTKQGGNGLYNAQEHLWWRDKDFGDVAVLCVGIGGEDRGAEVVEPCPAVGGDHDVVWCGQFEDDAGVVQPVDLGPNGGEKGAR